MFSRVGFFVFGFIAGGVTIMCAQKYHVVKAEDGTHLVPKMGATFSETYIDVREFGHQDWLEHPSLAAALVRADKSHVMKDAAVDSIFNGAEGFLQSLRD